MPKRLSALLTVFVAVHLHVVSHRTTSSQGQRPGLSFGSQALSVSILRKDFLNLPNWRVRDVNNFNNGISEFSLHYVRWIFLCFVLFLIMFSEIGVYLAFGLWYDLRSIIESQKGTLKDFQIRAHKIQISMYSVKHHDVLTTKMNVWRQEQVLKLLKE